MQKLLMLLLTLSLQILKVAVAKPVAFAEPGGWGDWSGRKCVSDAQAADFVAKIESLYHCMDPSVAEQTLTPDYKSYSYTLLRLGTSGGMVQVRLD